VFTGGRRCSQLDSTSGEVHQRKWHFRRFDGAWEWRSARLYTLSRLFLEEFDRGIDRGSETGTVIGHGPQAQGRRKETKRRHDLARQNWSPADQPNWLTEDVYATEIQPRLKTATLSRIATTVSVSIPYAETKATTAS